MPKRSLYLDLGTGDIDPAVSAAIEAAVPGAGVDQVARDAAAAAQTSATSAHAAAAAVNKAQVGLGNCDNTSDADKPVSTAQALADRNPYVLLERMAVYDPPYSGKLAANKRYAMTGMTYIGVSMILEDGVEQGDVIELYDLEGKTSGYPFHLTGQNAHGIEAIAAGVTFFVSARFVRFIYFPTLAKWKCALVEPADWFVSTAMDLYPGARRLADTGTTFYLQTNGTVGEEILLCDSLFRWQNNPVTLMPLSGTVNGDSTFVCNVMGATIRAKVVAVGPVQWHVSLA